MDDAHKIAILAEALRKVLIGAEVTGRWIDDEGGYSIESGDENGPPNGFYDSEDEMPVDGLRAATWETYTAEEQSEWLETCAWTARTALARAGLPEKVEGEKV